MADISLTWDGFRKQVFERATRLVELRNCSTFKLLGYKHLDIRLVLYFCDCNEVWDFVKDGDEVRATSFFTADKTHEDNMKEIVEFKDESERDKPENES